MSLTRDKKTIDVALTSPSYAGILEEQGSRTVSRRESNATSTSQNLNGTSTSATGTANKISNVSIQCKHFSKL